jgi:hypothetical protein
MLHKAMGKKLWQRTRVCDCRDDWPAYEQVCNVKLQHRTKKAQDVSERLVDIASDETVYQFT